MQGVPRNEKSELVYRPDDVLWTAGDVPRSRPFPTPTWETLQQMREVSKIPVVVKGVLTAEDTERAERQAAERKPLSPCSPRRLL